MRFGNLFLVLTVTSVLIVCAGSSYAKSRYESIDSYDKAQALYEKADYQNAVNAYLDFLKNYPDSALVVAAKYYIAECYNKTGNKEKALSYYNQIVKEYKKGFWADTSRDKIRSLK